MDNVTQNAPGDTGGKYQRSSVLIDKRFQFRYLALIAGTATLIMVVLGLLYADVLADQRELIGIKAISSGSGMTDDDARFDQEMNTLARNEDDIKVLSLFLSALVLVGILSWVAVRMTFRVVGPIRAASAMLRGIRNGDDSGIRQFRKGDEFMFLAQDIIDLRDCMRGREDEMKRMLTEAVAEIRKTGGDSSLADGIEVFLSGDCDRFPGRGRQD